MSASRKYPWDGPVLLVSRLPDIRSVFERLLNGESEEFNRADIVSTSKMNTGLDIEIYEKMPRMVLMEACFYHSLTPYRMSEFINTHNTTPLAIFNIGDYPPDKAYRFLQYGVENYVDLRCGLDEFIKGIDSILKKDREDCFISSSLKALRNKKDEICHIPENLTPKETEVRDVLIQGLSSALIADDFDRSHKTIENHKNKVYKYYGVKSPVGVLYKMLERGEFRAANTFHTDGG